MSRNKKPFPEALRVLMHERGVSFRKLAELTDIATDGHGYSPTYLSQLTKDAGSQRSARATMENIRVISTALNVRPEHFREYREDMAAEAAKTLSARIGYDEVMAALEALEQPPSKEDQ